MNIRTERNELSGGILEGFIPATLNEVPEKFPLELGNDKKTPYALVGATVTYPDGSSEVVTTRMYEASAKAEGITWSVGMKVELRTQLEGKYAGRSVVQLAGATPINLAKFGIKIDAGQPAVAV